MGILLIHTKCYMTSLRHNFDSANLQLIIINMRNKHILIL